MKRVAVHFTENGARIYTGTKALAFEGHPDALMDPEFPVGIPPHQWKREGKKIGVLAMGENGPKRFRARRRYARALSIGLGFAAGLGTGLLF